MKKVKGSFLFKVTASDGTVHEWLIDLKKGSGSVTKAPGEGRLNITSSLVLLVVHSTARVCIVTLMGNVLETSKIWSPLYSGPAV